jgi:hypothetical protein
MKNAFTGGRSLSRIFQIPISKKWTILDIIGTPVMRYIERDEKDLPENKRSSFRFQIDHLIEHIKLSGGLQLPFYAYQMWSKLDSQR